MPKRKVYMPGPSKDPAPYDAGRQFVRSHRGKWHSQGGTGISACDSSRPSGQVGLQTAIHHMTSWKLILRQASSRFTRSPGRKTTFQVVTVVLVPIMTSWKLILRQASSRFIRSPGRKMTFQVVTVVLVPIMTSWKLILRQASSCFTRSPVRKMAFQVVNEVLALIMTSWKLIFRSVNHFVVIRSPGLPPEERSAELNFG